MNHGLARPILLFLAVVLLLVTASATTAQQLEVTLDCPDDVGMEPNALTSCSFDYANSNPFALNDIEFTLFFDNIVETDIATALPDGVPTIADSSQQIWRPVRAVQSIPGSPSGFLSLDTSPTPRQQIRWTIPTIDAETSSEVFFGWHLPRGFPTGPIQLTLETRIGGTLDQSDPHTATWDAPEVRVHVTAPETVDPTHRYTGAAGLYKQGNTANSHTNAQIRVYLPYTDLPPGDGSYVADGNFNPSSHASLIDPTDINPELILRSGGQATLGIEFAGAFTASQAISRGDGTIGWPDTGDNAGELIIFDPDTNTLTANIGIVYSAETISEFEFYKYGWRLRWDAGLNSALTLGTGIEIPILTCLTSDQIAVDLTPPITEVPPPDFCHNGRINPDGGSPPTVVEEEEFSVAVVHSGCPGAGGNVCADESRPYAPSSDSVTATGVTRATFTNETSLNADVELYLQVPGHPDRGPDASLTAITVGAGIFYPTWGLGFGPDAAERVDIYVSTTAADYSGDTDPNDIPSRVLPETAGADWVLCTSTSDGNDLAALTCDAADMTSAGVDAALVQEVRVSLTGVRPELLSYKDVFYSAGEVWVASLNWALDSDIPSSMLNGTGPLTSVATEAFGTKVALVATLSDAQELTEQGATHSEVTLESFVADCGAEWRGSGAYESVSLDSCGSGWSTPGRTVMAQDIWAMGIGNNGTLDNVSGPFEFCVPVPEGLRFENDVTGDRFHPMVVETSISGGHIVFGTATALDPSTYTTSYCTDPACQNDTPLAGAPVIIAQYCVTVPTNPLSGDGTLGAGRSLQAMSKIRIVPGAGPVVNFGATGDLEAHATATGQDPAGTPRDERIRLNPGGWSVTGTAAITLLTDIFPGNTIQPNSQFCYDYEVDGHAFNASAVTPTLDPFGATLPTEDAVLYQWVPRSDVDAPGGDPPGPPDEPADFTPGDGDSLFVSASSTDPDAEAIWVHATEVPERGDATTLVTRGWQQCVDLVATPGGICNAAALSGLGLTTAEVRWVAVEFGTIEISDAEPRGVSPFDGNTIENNPYTAAFCLVEDGSADGDELIIVGEARSSNLLPVFTNPVVVRIDPLAPGALLVNEIDYDQDTTDTDEFIEIVNNTDGPIGLDGVDLILVNGSGGGASVYDTISLPDVDLAAGDYFVVCGRDANVENCDLEESIDDMVQDGAPDAVALVQTFGDVNIVIDTVSYEGGTGAPYTEGEGDDLEDSPSLVSGGISRVPDRTDTNDNNDDLSARCISPGEANLTADSLCLCGDGNLDEEAGEQCDAGEENGTTTCGCQSDCTWATGAVTCGDGAAVCSGQDTCNGAGECVANDFDDTTTCGAAATECSGQDMCNGSGVCLANNFDDTTTCGDGATECSGQDMCDGKGTCLVNDLDDTTTCGEGATECSGQDMCDGTGTCLVNDFDDTTTCGDGATECSGQDMCDGTGTCQVNDFDDTTTCGDGATECSGQDMCDGTGTCQVNDFDDTTTCGDPATECSGQDTCDGAGTCLANHSDDTTTCGDPATDCSAQDTCDGAGSCQPNHEDDAESCTDNGVFCDGEEICDAGVCVSPGNPCDTDSQSCLEGNAVCLDCGDTDLDLDGIFDNCDEDRDGDGIPNDDEGDTDPDNPDSDGDGLCDGWVDEPLLDVDGEVICEQGEDIDLDGEVDDDETDPLDPDSDGDCIEDGAEVLATPPSDPLDPDDPAELEDLDGDGIGNACDPDIDGDGLLNEVEDESGTDPYDADSDGDGLCDGFVASPLLDAEGEVVCEDGEDIDLDGEVDDGETDPQNPDSDGDCIDDGTEVLDDETDPLDLDQPTEGGECVRDECGDGEITSEEVCDDGDADSGDGCSSECVVEDGWVCDGEPSVCEVDTDRDGLADSEDNCPLTPNANQRDANGDGIGDECELRYTGGGPACGSRVVTSSDASPVVWWLLVGLGMALVRRRRG